MRSNELISSDEPIVERIAEEILERQRAGEHPTVEEYCQQYPEHAEELQAFLPALMVVEGLKPNSKDVSGTFGGEFDVEGKRREFIGDYRILRELGRGGMGVVYEAEQQSLGRHVALKVLLRSVAGDARAAKRFESEAKAAARMHHTNIVPVFDVGSDDEHLYYAMQLIQGQAIDLVIDDLKQLRNVRGSSAAAQAATKKHEKSIAHSLVAGQFHQDQLLEQTQDSSPSDTALAAKQIEVTETLDAKSSSPQSAVLPGQRDMSSAEDNRPAYFLSVAKIGHQTAEALAYAHARGIIHRDIKPSNLLLDGNGIVWITDFGLAKTGDHGMTHTGDILGTIRYMSPERFKGQCDVRADVYSLGLTLYELLTLQPAFAASDQLKLIDRIVKSEPPAPRTLDASVPRDLETIVLKCIDKDPRRRYQSADELCEDLDRYIHDEPVKARRISLPERVARWSRRNKGMAAALAVAATLLLIINIAGPWLTWRLVEKVEQLEIARNAEIEAKEIAKDAQGLANRNLYFSNMNLGAQLTMTMGAVERIKELTDPWRPVNGEPDLRGWEWYYLRSRLHQDLRTLRLPQGTVGADLNSDLSQLATHDRRTIWLWDPTTGKQLDSLPCGDAEVLSIAWHPDGTRLAISLMGEQNSVQVWQLGSGQQPATVCSSRWPVGRLWWRGEGLQLACASQEGISIFDFGKANAFPMEAAFVLPVDLSSIDSNRFLRRRGRISAMIAASWSKSIALSPEWRKIATHAGVGMRSGARIEFSNIEPGMQASTFESIPFARGQWSPNGKFLASAITHNLQVWEVSKPQVHGELSGHIRAVQALAWRPDSTVLASAGDDYTIRLWDPKNAIQQRVLQGHTARIHSLWWNLSGDQMASCSDDGTIKFWSVANDGQPPLEEANRTVSNWSPNNEQHVLAIAGSDGMLKVWDANSDMLVSSISAAPGSGRSVAFSPDGKFAVMGQHTGPIKIFEVATGKPSQSLGSHATPGFYCVDWSPKSGKYLAATVDGSVEVWDLDQVEREQIIAGSDFRSLAWSKDEKYLAAGNSRGRIMIWDRDTGYVKELEQLADRIMSLSWSPKGRFLVSGGDEGIFLWDVEQGRRFPLEGHTNGVQCVDFSPDGKRIASCSSDSTVKVWDAHSRNEVLTLTGHKIFVRSVKWSHDGSCLASTDANGVTIVWDARKGYAHQEIELSSHDRKMPVND